MYQDRDVINNPTLMREAIDWAKRQVESGNANDFVRSVVLQGNRHGRISVAQARGLLNCKHALEERRSQIVQKAVPADALDLSALPHGRFHYAVENEQGETSFYVIDHIAPNDDSRWAGWAFVSQHVGPNEERRGAQRPGTGYKGSHGTLVAKIVADPKAAMLKYGLEIGRCGHCNRRLTNEESRNIGMGPICRGHFGW